jgi:hypothetical protein
MTRIAERNGFSSGPFTGLRPPKAGIDRGLNPGLERPGELPFSSLLLSARLSGVKEEETEDKKNVVSADATRGINPPADTRLRRAKARERACGHGRIICSPHNMSALKGRQRRGPGRRSRPYRAGDMGDHPGYPGRCPWAVCSTAFQALTGAKRRVRVVVMERRRPEDRARWLAILLADDCRARKILLKDGSTSVR